jgi:RNA polymerase sigma-70 factor (ECF subfamily)
MLGSAFEADDAVQETLVRAWRGLDRFEGRASLRSWLYSIATNVCLTMLRGRKRRALPVDVADGDTEPLWLQPIPDHRALPPPEDPGDAVAGQESIRLAFVAALQHLPPRQRAVLILRDVLRWRSDEVAELLATTPTSVKSLLQRARVAMAALPPSASRESVLRPREQELLARYVDAFERYDVADLVALLHDDATLSMPPMPICLRGPEVIDRWWRTETAACRGSRMVRVAANGAAAFAHYRLDPTGDGWQAFAIHVVDVDADGIRAVECFIEPELFAVFDLPDRLAV